jgi:hypothetical protein
MTGFSERFGRNVAWEPGTSPEKLLLVQTKSAFGGVSIVKDR